MLLGAILAVIYATVLSVDAFAVDQAEVNGLNPKAAGCPAAFGSVTKLGAVCPD